MEGLFVFMEVNQSLEDLFDDFLALILINFSNKFGQISIWAVFKDNDKVLLFFEEEELSGFDNVGVLKGDVHLSLFFCIIFLLFVDGDDFDCVQVFVDRFSEVDFSKITSSKKLDKRIIIDFLKHFFEVVLYLKR